MRYAEAKKLSVGDRVWVPEERQNGIITEIQEDEDSKDLFFRVKTDTYRSVYPLYHHAAVQQEKSLDEIVDFFVHDKRTEVAIKHNNETGKWLYSIEVKDSGAFWLCSFDTEGEAVAYIKEHNLKRCDSL